MASGKRTAEPARAATYLAHSSTFNARTIPPSTPDNTPRTRKPKSKKKREERYEEEIQYNLSYDFRGAASRRQAQSSRMSDEADFPPPPTYETATAVSTLVSENFVHQSGPVHPGLVSPAVTVASLPVPGARFLPAVSDRSDTFSIDTASLSILQRPPEEDGSSIELVDLEPSERWELDRVRGMPLTERVKRHKLRTESNAPATMPPGPPFPHTGRARLASQPTVSRNPGLQARFLASQLSLRIPESRDRYEDDRNQDNNSDLSTPPTPKHHRMPSIPGSPARFFHAHGRSHSPQPSSSVISLLRNPSPFFKSAPSLLNVSPSHHGTPHRDRARTKLFHRNRKSKERASSEPLEDWEVLERTGSGESGIDDSLPPPSPATPQNTVKRQLHKLKGPDVFGTPPSKSQAERSRKVNTVQLPQAVGSDVNRPASPPFVARHVRRYTTSSRGSQMSASSAPVSPISVTSTATFNTADTCFSEKTTASEDIPADIQVASEPTRTGSRDRGSSLSSRTPSRTPRVSSPPPPVETPAYDHDPDLPIMPNNPALTSLPARSATERIVRSSDARDDNHVLVRGRSLSRDMGMRSAPAYSSIFPSGPPTPLPNTSQSLPPTTQSSPRRHYPGRPLPATPPISPSLTWILDKGVTRVVPYLKPTVSTTPSTPPIPEGLLIDLDDDSLDTPSQPTPNPTTPPCEDILGLDDDNGDDNDNVSDSGTVSPPGPLTPTTSGFASASSLTLSTAASRSVEFFDASMQTTPTSDVPDINGLVSSLGDQGMSDGSNYDALLLIADLLGPATPPPPLPATMPLLLGESDPDSVDLEPVNQLDPSYLVGNVELVRRRVTKDGRVKLKMSLLGVAVEKCAICMTQFKADDAGILGATCQHACVSFDVDLDTVFGSDVVY
ncbi:hypothetical protein JVU11DRAFT_10024 [Chiua virens]|nr:hypothetical protein JVU11DRAFT_10024 [Chiua virens]